jgi:hypothetical protein
MNVTEHFARLELRAGMWKDEKLRVCYKKYYNFCINVKVFLYISHITNSNTIYNSQVQYTRACVYIN